MENNKIISNSASYLSGWKAGVEFCKDIEKQAYAKGFKEGMAQGLEINRLAESNHEVVDRGYQE